MNNRKSILAQLKSADYMDMHIHLEDYNPGQISPEILYLGNSVDRKSYESTLQLSKVCPSVIPAFGIHPMRAVQSDYPLNEIESLIRQNTLIGEIGLDFLWIEDRSTDERQREVFHSFLSFLKKYRAIPSIHTKGAEREILDSLRKEETGHFIIHWYSGPVELIPAFLELGGYFTIGPDIFTDSEIYQHIPRERLFAETDNPTGMPWVCKDGGFGRNSNGCRDIINVYKKLSEKMDLPLGELQELFKDNLKALLA